MLYFNTNVGATLTVQSVSENSATEFSARAATILAAPQPLGTDHLATVAKFSQRSSSCQRGGVVWPRYQDATVRAQAAIIPTQW